MRNFAILFLLVGINASAADAGLDQLKQSFANQIQASTKEFDKAAALRPISLPLGPEISKQSCEALKAKIAPNYKVNPFDFSYVGGSSRNAMCGGAWGWQKNHLQIQSGVSSLGLPYAMALQLEGREVDQTRTSTSTFFIDARYRIVEIQDQTVVNDTKELTSYRIISLDQKDGLYVSAYDKSYGISGGLAKDVRGEHHIEQFIPADGSSVYPMLRNTVKNAADPSKDYQILSWDRADKKDWLDYVLPITFYSSGGFYNYGGKYYSTFGKPNFKSTLTIKKRGGKEFCAHGDIKADNNWDSFPADSAAYYNCVNY